MEQLRMATLRTYGASEAACYRLCSIPFYNESTVENMILLLFMECHVSLRRCQGGSAMWRFCTATSMSHSHDLTPSRLTTWIRYCIKMV